MAQRMNDEFMQTIIKEEAWKQVSKDFNWTEALLEKYQDNVDWEEISDNTEMSWTVPMIKKFAKKLNWTKFSANAKGRFLTQDSIELFKDYWDWHELSGNNNVYFTHELLDKYADYWDWERIINLSSWNNPIFKDEGVKFYTRYQKYIPATKLQGSTLWDEMVENQMRSLISEIIA